MVSTRYDPTVWKHSDHHQLCRLLQVTQQSSMQRWQKQFAFYFAAADQNKKATILK